MKNGKGWVAFTDKETIFLLKSWIFQSQSWISVSNVYIFELLGNNLFCLRCSSERAQVVAFWFCFAKMSVTVPNVEDWSHKFYLYGWYLSRSFSSICKTKGLGSTCNWQHQQKGESSTGKGLATHHTSLGQGCGCKAAPPEARHGSGNLQQTGGKTLNQSFPPGA